MINTTASSVLEPTWSSGVARLRAYSASDRKVVEELLIGLPELYPGADKWLSRRLTEVNDAAASCTLAFVSTQCVGLAIETPKDKLRVKLSTLYVHPDFRQRGIASSLVRKCWDGWRALEFKSAHVTVRAGRHKALSRVLRPFGFRFHALAMNRYGNGQHEIVYQTSPSDNPGHELLRNSER